MEAEVRIRPEGDERVARFAVARVHAEGQSVRAVFIQDTTEDRRVRDALERQAHALERHASELVACQRGLEAANLDLKRANERLAL